jgi:hypothetical protein
LVFISQHQGFFSLLLPETSNRRAVQTVPLRLTWLSDREVPQVSPTAQRWFKTLNWETRGLYFRVVCAALAR